MRAPRGRDYSPRMSAAPSPTMVRRQLRAGEAPRPTPAVFVQLGPEDQVRVLERLRPEEGTALLRDSDSASVAPGLRLLGPDRAAPLLREIPPDDLADLLLRLEPSERGAYLAPLGPELGEEVSRVLSYPPDSAGGLMSPRFPTIPEPVTAARALELIREYARIESLNYLYVVDPGGKLVGTLPVRALLAAGPRDRVADLCARKLVTLPVRATRDEVVAAFRAQHYLALPVVDEHGRIVGVITADDVLEAAREEADLVLYGATGADARESVWNAARAARLRLPWTTVTVLGGLGCAAVTGLFQAQLERVVVLALFVPLVLALSEAVAAQTSTLVMRELYAGRSATASAGFLGKEILIALLVSIYAALLVGGASWFWHRAPGLGLAIGGAVMASVVWASVLGVTVPGVLRRFRIEPSLAAGPLALTLADLSTLGIYFGLASLA